MFLKFFESYNPITVLSSKMWGSIRYSDANVITPNLGEKSGFMQSQLKSIVTDKVGQRAQNGSDWVNKRAQ